MKGARAVLRGEGDLGMVPGGPGPKGTKKGPVPPPKGPGPASRTPSEDLCPGGPWKLNTALKGAVVIGDHPTLMLVHDLCPQERRQKSEDRGAVRTADRGAVRTADRGAVRTADRERGSISRVCVCVCGRGGGDLLSHHPRLELDSRVSEA